MMATDEEFRVQFVLQWQRYLAGNGAVELTDDTLTFSVVNTSTRRYSDAQIDDYQGLPRRHFCWRPPLRLTVRARFSHPAGELRGTAGFGFWNDPFMMTGVRVPALPSTIWFFYASLPSDMKLDHNTPGWGWKAATIDALRLRALLWAPFAPAAVLLMQSRALYHRLWPSIQRALGVRETLVAADMAGWHTYVIEWETERSHFSVDGERVLQDAPSPRGPLGFVMWLDNQYMAVTPWGRLRWGLLAIGRRQWMQVDRLEVTT